MMQFFTIGVYNSSEEDFFSLLTKNDIDTFCDIRQRRGVRGSQYTFVNSIRLQEKLQQLNIKYLHISGLAPTSDIRELQAEADIKSGTARRARQILSPVFVKEYEKRILDKFDFNDFLDQLKNAAADKIVLFCVEETAMACHRSLVAEKLKNDFGFAITHLQVRPYNT